MHIVTCYFYQLTMSNWLDLHPYPETVFGVMNPRVDVNIGGERLDIR